MKPKIPQFADLAHSPCTPGHPLLLRNSPWAFFVNNWKVALLTLLTFFIGGIFAMLSMPQESNPEVKIPIGVVTVLYPGASPGDVEKLVTDKLEEKLQNLDQLKRITSNSSEGVASLTVEFAASADLTESMRELRDEVDNVRSELPDTVKDPNVLEVRAGDEPIVTFSLLGNVPPAEFKKYGEDLQDQLEGVSGVSRVVLTGLAQREMQVLVRVAALDGYELSLGQVVGAIRRNHVDMPIGNLLTNNFYYQVSLKGQFATASELNSLPVASRAGQNIYLRDIATVREVFGMESSKSRVYRAAGTSYREAITLQVYKKTGANIIDIVDASKEFTVDYKQNVLPPDIDILTTNDNSEFIRDDIRLLSTNALQTITIIFILLLLALGLGEALLVSLAIPLIFLISFIVLAFIGETLNGLVLFALILSLGLVVDTSIVIMEGVTHAMKQSQLSPYQAALSAIYTFKVPLISGTFTTVAAFIPMALMSGIMGEYVRHIPITVTTTLLASLGVAIMLLPAVAARALGGRSAPSGFATSRQQFFQRLGDWYAVQIRQILSSKAKRRIWTAGMLLSFVITLSFPFIGLMQIQMFPLVDTNFFTVQIEAPTGTTLAETRRITLLVEQMIETLPELDNFVTIIGGASVGTTQRNFGGGAATTSADTATITVNLTPKEDRELKSYEISDLLRPEVASITAAKVTVLERQAGPPTGAPVEVRIIGEDLDELELVALAVQAELEQVAGAREITNDISHGPGEFHFTLRRDRLEYYGLSALTLASELRTAVYGDDSIQIVHSGTETPIVVRLDFRTELCQQDQLNTLLAERDELTVCDLQPQNIAQVQNLLIPTARGPVSVGELAEISLQPAVTTIRHRDTEVVVNVKSYTREDTTPATVIEKLQKRVATSISVPASVRIAYGGETEDTTESFRSLARAMVIGILLIAFILVLQFNSFSQPFIILFTIPLSLIGVFVGLTLLGKNFSFPGFIGIVALTGVVVNNAIILIDRINSNIAKGLVQLEAIVEAGSTRLRPIILTALTTSAGVLPLALSSEIWGDLAWTLAIGVLFSTVLTLVMVPIFYFAMEQKKPTLTGHSRDRTT